MKAVIISIQPKWCELIASGQKTVEVRKTKPKIPTPFKCYIYKSFTFGKDENKNVICNGCGKVIGEFVCDRISETNVPNYDDEEIFTAAQLRYRELKKYANGKTVFLWHISDLMIYDKPKELGELGNECKYIHSKTYDNCVDCKFFYSVNNEFAGRYYECAVDRIKPLSKPPQSWCYIEELV